MNEFRIKIVLTREKKKSRKVMNERKWQHVNLKHTKKKKKHSAHPQKTPQKIIKQNEQGKQGQRKHISTFSPNVII